MEICIQICAGREWRAIKNIFKISPQDILKHALGEYFTFKINEQECILYHSGSTKTRASAACQHAIDTWKPKVIFVLGTCGGVSEKLHVFDIVMASKTVQYECLDLMGEAGNRFYSPMITDLDNNWIDSSNLNKDIITGIIGTGDRDLDYQTAESLRKENILVVDWESGAISKICEINNIKCLVLRGITDMPVSSDQSDREQQTNDYRENTYKVMKKLVSLLPAFIGNI